MSEKACWLGQCDLVMYDFESKRFENCESWLLNSKVLQTVTVDHNGHKSSLVGPSYFAVYIVVKIPKVTIVQFCEL